MKLVEIISKETIKPSSPTPSHSKIFKLSLLDQLASSSSYEPLLLFYSFNGGDTHHNLKLSLKLKQSLSETLTRFYPLAGRVEGNIAIDCSDHGAVYVHAKVYCLLQDFLKQPNGDSVKQLTPLGQTSEADESESALLLVQSSFFSGGGVAISVCISHKIADASTVITFIKSWASLSHDDDHQVSPLYNASSLFPPRDVPVSPPSAALFLTLPLDFNLSVDRCITKRFVLDGSKIVADLNSGSTRVEAVTALIWKSAVNASRSNTGVSKLSIMSQCVNIRKIAEPPLPDSSVGNLVGYYAAQKDESDVHLQGLARELRKGIRECSKSYMQKLRREDALEAITESCKDDISILLSNDVDLYMCTSVLWADDASSLYGVDFGYGWGKPTWVTDASTLFGENHHLRKNVVGLVDSSKGDGSVEAWVTLTEADMALFERDPELISYAAMKSSDLTSSL